MTQFILHKQLEADSDFISDLKLSQLRLMNQSAVKWLILVPRIRDAVELHHLKYREQIMLVEEISWASKTLEKLYTPDKINVGMLGNIVSQLHVHIVARRNDDPAWPGPIWGRVKASVYESTDCNKIIEAIKTEVHDLEYKN